MDGWENGGRGGKRGEGERSGGGRNQGACQTPTQKGGRGVIGERSCMSVLISLMNTSSELFTERELVLMYSTALHLCVNATSFCLSGISSSTASEVEIIKLVGYNLSHGMTS